MVSQDTEISEVAQAAVSSTEVVLRDAQELAITSDDDFRSAGARLREIVTRRKDIDDERKRLVRPLDETRSRIQEFFRPALDNLSRAEQLIKGCISTWTAEQERRRRIAEAEAEAAARKESDRLAAQAQKAESKGQFEKAAALTGQAENVPIAEVEAPAIARGISTRENWKASVVDKGALVQAVAEGKVPLDVLDVNMTVLNQMARALKSNLNYPGVEAVKDIVVAARSGLDGGYMPRRSER